MKLSSDAEVAAMYDQITDSYCQMMDEEIRLPLYEIWLRALARSIADIPGPVLDTSCGTGHLLARYHEEFDSKRDLKGIDLAENMVTAAQERLGEHAQLALGDMRDLSVYPDGSVAAIVSFFAIHHLAAEALLPTFQGWRRVLKAGGCLLLGSWEGESPIDYGDSADLVAVRHSQAWMTSSLEQAEFEVESCELRYEEEVGMSSIYLLAKTRPA